MTLKGQKTTADYLEWEALKILITRLQRDKEFRFCLLIAIGSFCGLRISDILNIKWNDLIKNGNVQDSIMIIEKKTAKSRKIQLNSDIKNIILLCFTHLHNRFIEDDHRHKITLGKKYKSPELFQNQYIFINKEGNVYTTQYVNQHLKVIREFYDLPITNFSTHTFRKTFGREVWKKSNYSDKALILLNNIFNHVDIKTTKRYIGITDDEIQNIYNSLTF